MAKVLVTGGAGFVGTVLSNRLVDEGHDVTVFDTFEYGVEPTLFLVKRGVRCQYGDVTNIDQIGAAIKQTDFVFHLAGMVGFPMCQKEPEKARRVNVEGAKNILAAAAWGRKHLPIINASTGSVYGKVDDICDETANTNPQSLYGITKLEAEKYLGQTSVHLRFATLFGASPCMRFDLLPNNFVMQAKKFGYLVLYRPDDRRTFLSVDDAVDAYIRAMNNFDKACGHVINIGDEAFNLTKRQLAEIIRDLYPMSIHVKEGVEDPDYRDYEVKYTKAKELLDFKAKSSMNMILKEVGDIVDIAQLALPWRLNL